MHYTTVISSATVNAILITRNTEPQKQYLRFYDKMIQKKKSRKAYRFMYSDQQRLPKDDLKQAKQLNALCYSNG